MLLKMRAQHAAFRTGTQRVIHTGPNDLLIERAGGGERFLILVNLSNETATIDAKDLHAGRNKVVLKPYESAVLKE